MKRIFSSYAYGPGPRAGCWWDETVAPPEWAQLRGDLRVDVAIIGGGFTGISAALHLAEAGTSVALLEAETPGWGASGRNGGFCCLGGAMLSDAALARTHGAAAAVEYRAAEHAAVDLVSSLLDRLKIDADCHSNGETQLAHRPKDMRALRRTAEHLAREPGVDPVVIEKGDLAAHGMGGPFHGALTIPVGFALNPQKYLFGLARAAEAAGALLFQRSPATTITRAGGGHVVETATGDIRSDCVLIATNGYSSEDVPRWLSGRYLPAQSNVMVTRPISDAELHAQGWSTDQMAYDTRDLLHYFRLMPDRRFLFGMRGGLTSSPAAEARARRATRRDFEAMFPQWRHVETTHGWSGMVCLSRSRMPFIGPVPGHAGQFAGLAYHGNGVAMGSYAGRILAALSLGHRYDGPYPAPMRTRMRRFELGPARRAILPPLYAAMLLGDM